MKKFSIYFAICILIVSLCPVNPLTAYAEENTSEGEAEDETNYSNDYKDDSPLFEKEVEYNDEEVVLFAERIGGEIDLFDNIPQENDEPFSTIPDESLVTQFIPIKNDKDSLIENGDFTLIGYTYLSENFDKTESEKTVFGYVHNNHVIPKSEADKYKSNRVDEDTPTSKEESEDNKDHSNENADDELDDTSTIKDKEIIVNQESIQSTAKVNSDLKKGDSNPRVKQLKLDLAKLGFVISKNPNNNFGPSTEGRVKEFQKKYNLKQTGVADKTTLNKISELLNSFLSKGMKNNDVLTMKKDLAKIGFIVSTNPNTVFGPSTEKTVKSFQEYYGLNITGIVNIDTKDKINSILSSYYQNGYSHNNVIKLKNNLEKLGFKVSNNPNEKYGPTTRNKVKEFQKFYSLKVNGIADDVTLYKINNLLNSPMKKGDYRKDAILFKDKLKKVGFIVSSKPTPAYGPATEKKVKEFQKYFNLKETGTADKETILKLDSILNTHLQNGKKHPDVITFKTDLQSLGFKISNNPNQSYGPTTTKKVKEFQKYYNLNVNGIGDPVTLAKIDSILNSHLRINQSHNDVIKLKEDLIYLGYGDFAYENKNYGPKTRDAVIKFQKANNLAVNGIADEITLAKIVDLVNGANTKPPKPVNKTEYTDYKLTLNNALDIQMARPTIITDKYKSDPAFVSAKYLQFTGSAKVSGSIVNIRTAPDTSKNNIAFQLAGGIPITITGTKNGTLVSGSPLWYEFKRSGETYYIHSSLASGAQAKATANVYVRAGKGSSYHSFGLLKKGQSVNIIAQGPSWHEISYGAWRNPTRADMKGYLDPSKNDKFQHLRLDSTVGVSASELNKALTGKGVLAGQGQAFINGSKKHGVNEAYLMSHAFLESGHGTSTLAKGVEVGKNKSGKLVRVTTNNRNSLTAIKTTYNMFGIGAVDSDPLNGGSITAYENGWFTPAKAIEGGAKWIGEGYIYNEHNQNTLYKMKWNPRMSEGFAWKQYATDIAWATKQVSQIKNIYSQLNNPSYHYDIARYK